MNIVARNRISAAVASIVAVLVLTMMMLGNPADVAAQNGPTPRAYITVGIAAGDDTVSWSDPGGCSSEYNIYKAVRPHPSRNNPNPQTSRTLLDTAVSGSSQATLAISHSRGNPLLADSVKVELYCGAFDAESSENDLVESTELPRGVFSGFWEGTYSSAPLTALTISPGTLSPGFERGIGRYSVEVESDVEVITLDPAVLTEYQTDFFRNPTRGAPYTGIVLSDADTETAGFQANLTPGENQLGIRVNNGRVSASPRLYYITVRSQNSPATGAPTIGGIAQVGQTLKADTSGISDTDGLTNVAYSYQWLAGDNVIGGATNSTHTLQAAEAGKVIEVQVTFDDDAGYLEYLTSEATAEVAPNFPATGPPTITGTVEVGETLTADTSGIDDLDGLDNVSFSYQWIRSGDTADLNDTGAPFQWNPTDGTADLDIDGATGAIYTVTVADVGKAVKLRVNFTDDKGSVESLTSSATVVVPVEAAFTFSIDGTTVTCDSYNVHIVNLPEKECDDPSSIDQGASDEIEVEIEIARSVNSQLYKFRFHIYQMEDSIGRYRTVEANDLCLGPGLADSVSMEVTPADGTGNFTYTGEGTIFNLCPPGTYQLYVPWYRYNYEEQEYEYAGSFRRYFFINGDDEGVTHIKALYPDTPVSHDEVQIQGTKQSEVLNRELTTFSLTIDGLVPDSDTETTDYVVRLQVIGENGPYEEVPWCHVGNVGYSHLLKTVPEDGRWAMDAHVLGSCIRGQWPDTLQVELFDGPDLTNYSEPIVLDGSYIISFTGELQYPEYGTYRFIAGKDIVFRPQPTIPEPTIPEPTIPEIRGPTISGTAQVGETLTVDTSGMVGPDGEYNVSFSYQWIAIDGTTKTNIVGATDSTYTLVADDAGKTIIVWVKRSSLTDGVDHIWTEYSTATEVVTFAVPLQTANSPATGTLAISGTVQVGETLTVDTSGISDADGLDNVAYSYQWLSSRDTEISGATNDSYALVSDDEGKAIKVKVAFTDDAGNQEMLTSAPTAVVSAPAQVDYENEPSELSHLTVVVTEDDSDPDNVVSTFTITWNDAEDCSASYNAYLDGVVGDPIHLGSAASEGDQIAGSLTNVSAETFGFNANLHCGTIGSGRLVDRLWIPEYNRSIGTLPISRAYLPKPGTYSTEPGLIALTVSSGTLTPAFHNHTLNYTVPDVPNADGRFTVTTTAKADYYNVAFIPGSYYTFFSVCSYGGQQTSLSYGDDAGNRIYPLTDADANTPGFQMDLDEGENVFYIRVWPNCETGQLYKLTLTRAASAPANTPATGAPTIGGTARVGQPLTADTTGIADSDGLENATFAYQWLADDTKIDGATHSTYTLVVADEGQTIKVEVSFTDDADNEETLTSTATAEVAAAAPTDPPGAPRNLTGIANSDGTVTLRWDAPNDDSVSGYQILRRRPREGENTLLVLVNDTGSTDTEYTDNDVTPDVGHAYRVKAINAVGLGRQSKFVSVTPTQPAGPAQNNPATGTPTISGTAQVGETLTADTSGIGDDDGLANVTFSYQWIASDEAVDIDITSATVSSYTLVDADEGQTIQVQVSFTDDAGNDESLTSAATATIAAAPNSPATGSPAISGTAQVGQTLTASTSGIADDDGLTNVSYTYQWIANDGISDSDIQDATLSTYTLVSDDVGKTIKVKVSFTDDAENEETLTSAATDSVVTVANPIAGICDRTEQVQDAILGWLNGVDDCADVTGSHLAGITIGLRISSNDPNDRPALSLKPGDFAGLVNIEELAIYYHTMDALPEDIFNGLGSLERLYLSSNDIAALPEDVFDGLGNLVRLDLEGTHLSALPEDVFDGLGNLESLDLRRNQIGTLPENVFDGLGNLKSLDLGGNQIDTLPEGVFDGLGSLESLELFGNRINALPEDVFDGLGSLTFLRLSFNQLSALLDDVFDDLGNLVHLDMQENQIGTLPEGVYNGLSSLERLDLSYNEIAALPEDVFDGLGNLKSLGLNSNDLASPPEDVFDGLDSLGHLALSHNRIHTLPEDVFEGLGDLTSLSLHANQISVLPEDVFDELGNLTALYLGGNQLGALPEGVFDELGNLTSLGLGGNRIGPLAEDFFDELGNLTLLDLSSNGLGAVPEGFFDELGNLTFLGLHRNQIRALPEDVFDGLSNLEQLYLFENQLGALPEDVFDGLGNLERLYLFENQLGALPEDVFDGLSNLNELYLYRNQLSALPEDVFDGLSNLNELYLWGNPGTPFTLTADLERQGDNAVLVKVAEGVPFDMAVTLSAAGGTLSAASVTIKGGTAGSEAVTVTRSGDGPVTVSVVSAVFQAGDYNGIQADLGEPLILGDAEGDNRPATGTPAISEAVQVGETLTVDTSGIADEDGLDNVSYSYQWLSSRDTEIDGATGSTYTLQGTDLGKIIKVRVTFTDDAGNEETLTSAATDAVEARPNSPATGDPTISGTAQVGETLTADASGIADEDGLTNATFAYQWLADGADITGATGVTYIPVAADAGKAMNVRVTFTDDAGSEEELTSTITASVAAKANTPATGALTIGGTVQVGETLTADTSGISDADGLTNVAYSYQWLSSRDSEIAGATSATYTLVDADGGKAIKVRVSFTDDSGNEETLTSAATGAVAARPNSAARGAPTISGTAQVGQTLTASTSGIADDDGLTNVSYTYQWIANDVISDSDIQDATLSTYTLVSDDVGKTIKVKVSFTDDAENEETLTSAATDSAVAAPASNSPATGAPSITGTTQVGETLIASTTGISDTDGLTNVSYAYQWLTSRDAEIDGATSSTYTLVESDEGKTIKVRVSFTDDADSSEELTSAATSAVAAAPLTATVHDEPAPHDGQSVFTFELRFSESPKDDFSYKTLRDHAFAVTGGEVTYVRRLEPGKNVRWEITATPDSDADVSVVLPVTTDCNADGAICTGDGRMLSEEMALTVSGPAAPASNSLATGAPTITGTERVSETLTASTTGIADEDGLDNVTLNYQWLADDADINGATASTYTLADEDAGKVIKVMVSFTDDAGNDEELTSAVTGAVAAAPPPSNTPATGSPSITGAAQVGETLTAVTTGISDHDGLNNAAFAYQWFAADAEINGATASIYTLADEDAGKVIKVQVSFTDDAGNDEDLTSAVTGAVAAAPPPPNTPATGAPSITGTAQVGETLTAYTTGISDDDGLNNAAFAYQWFAADAEINGATASTYTLADEDAGKAIKVRVSFTDDAGNDEQLTSAVTGAVTAAVVTLPLTASVHNVPSSHNGQDAFIFELRFGEAPEPDFSYKTVWDHAFTVTEGSVTYVRRLEPGKNVRWEITVTPDSSADVAIALNATTDCEAVGAICTSDGERLSASISAIVSGPVPVGTVPVAVIVSGTTPVAEGATVSFTISLNRAAPTALSVAVSVADAGGVLSGAAPRSVAFATGDNSKAITLPTRDDNAIKTATTVTVSLATGSGYTLGTATSASVSVTDNDTAVWTVSVQPTEIAEGGSSTITLAVANGKTFTANQTVSLAVSGTASGSDYSLSDTEFTLPAGASSVTATLTARDDASVESDETVIVTATHDGQPIGSATVTIEANDVAVWTVSVQPTEIAEGGSSTITLAVANGKTFAANQTVSLAVSGTASGSDYSLSDTELTLPAGASSVTATLTARDDASVESDETVIVTATHDGQPIGSATVTIEANDVAVWTVSVQPTEIAEGGSSTITLAVANGKTFAANQTVSLAVSGTASGSDYSLSDTEFTLPAGASSVTATLTARDDASVESDETVIVTATHDGQPIGSATVTIEANDVAVWTVSVQPTEIAEGGSSTITLAVANGKTFAANQTVSLAVSGTASGSDYSLSDTELTLPAGASSVTATLTARDDASVESDETVIVTATHDGQPIGSATVTIEANDVPLSNDATLSTLSLSGIDIGTFSSGTTDYSAIVEYDVASTTVTADPNDDGASVAVAEANGVTYGISRQVSLSSGDNKITVTVTAEDENAMKVYTVTVTRAEPDAAWGERLPDRDIVLDSDAIPTGLWADDTNAWVISDCNVGEVNVYALSDGSKQDELSFTLAGWSGCATALWSNGATLWVADFFSNGVRAYRLSDGARQSDQDLDRDAMLAAGNTIPSGLWSNGEIMWVADHSAGKVFAYRLSDWARVSTREFDLTDGSGVPIRPFGLWSNGETLLASNWNGDRVLAYDLSDGQRQTSLDIDTSASGTRNSGIWSDGETLWIVDDLDKRIYAYAVQGLGSTR